MSITNEQAMQELLNLKHSDAPAFECALSYKQGVLMGMTCAYWRAGIISFAQYQLLMDMKEKVPAQEQQQHGEPAPIQRAF